MKEQGPQSTLMRTIDFSLRYLITLYPFAAFVCQSGNESISALEKPCVPERRWSRPGRFCDEHPRSRRPQDRNPHDDGHIISVLEKIASETGERTDGWANEWRGLRHRDEINNRK